MTARVERAVRSAVPGTATGRRGLPSPADAIESLNEVNQPKAVESAPARNSISDSHQPAFPTGKFKAPVWSAPTTSSDPATVSFGKSPHTGGSDIDDSSAREVLLLLGQLERHHGTLRILYLLATCGELTAYQLRKSLPIGQRALSGALGVLDRANLIEARRAKPFPYVCARTYRLSARGGVLGSKLLESWNLLLGAGHH